MESLELQQLHINSNRETTNKLPIMNSRNLAPVPVDASMLHQDPFLYLERQNRHIQQHLQVLLDAQSEGLIAGLSVATQDDVLSNGSSTPTPSLVSNPRGPKTIPVRQPPKKKIGLRSARRGILKSMHELLSLKEEEYQTIDVQLKDRRNALKGVDNLENKRHGLGQAISTIQGDPETVQVDALKQESRSLEADIYELETKLLEKKARHRHVVDEISQIQNAVDSKLSSYKSSLSLLDSDVQRFLRNPLIQPLPTRSAEQTPFYSLSPSRRTLDMAKEHWRAEQAELRKRQRGVDSEIGALKEGGAVWQSVVSKVAGFEHMLRKEMHESIQSQSQLLGSAKSSLGNAEDARVKTILKEMNNTTDFLESKLQSSEEKDWKLLVCCITAELEAFKEAKALLLGSLHMDDDNDEEEALSKDESVGVEDKNDESSTSDPLGVGDPSEPPADLLGAASSPQDAATRSEDEDDEPDPAWLLSDS